MEQKELERLRERAMIFPGLSGPEGQALVAALEAAWAEKAQVIATLRAWEKKARGGYHEALEDILSLMEAK